MRRLRPSITVIQAKVIHCRRSTEIPLARGTIRSLNRCHWIISHCASAERRTMMILARRMYMCLLHTHSTSRLRKPLPAERLALMTAVTGDTRIYALDFIAPDKKWRETPSLYSPLVDVFSIGLFFDWKVMFSLFSP